ncbi:hypothetical protein I302_102599 [Kwoniella bestiolae CBS 10118]|uniref:Methyltransferase type 11 domain-containing protein n=1 Tax=Kwoniella bestiolae CBS 10118 TaxID=1296100 RepID=A0A1B9GFF0_9TREE|nr:hypothetical protein I302_01286 [Kwoniella bestiolae CBS 10118]OCF29773.1 hypothetical protein I302_01286 [Kwoniella bestiolae CBS 10118]
MPEHQSSVEPVNRHGDAHSHSHGQGHDATEADSWANKDYLNNPEALKLAKMSYDFIIQSLTSAGIDKDVYAKWDVLEIGCGPGVVTRHLLPTFNSVHAIDNSQSMILLISQYLPPETHQNFSYSLHTLSPDSSRLFSSGVPLKSPVSEDLERELIPPRESFDLAVVNWVLHHVDDVPSFMGGAVGLLKEGGWLVITEMGRREGGDKIDEKPTPDGSFNAPDHYRSAYTPQSLIDVFESHGLVDVHAELTADMPVFGSKDREGGRKVPALIVRGRKGDQKR